MKYLRCWIFSIVLFALRTQSSSVADSDPNPDSDPLEKITFNLNIEDSKINGKPDYHGGSREDEQSALESGYDSGDYGYYDGKGYFCGKGSYGRDFYDRKRYNGGKGYYGGKFYYNHKDYQSAMLDKIKELIPDKSPLIIIPSPEGDPNSEDSPSPDRDSTSYHGRKLRKYGSKDYNRGQEFSYLKGGYDSGDYGYYDGKGYFCGKGYYERDFYDGKRYNGGKGYYGGKFYYNHKDYQSAMLDKIKELIPDESPLIIIPSPEGDPNPEDSPSPDRDSTPYHGRKLRKYGSKDYNRGQDFSYLKGKHYNYYAKKKKEEEAYYGYAKKKKEEYYAKKKKEETYYGHSHYYARKKKGEKYYGHNHYYAKKVGEYYNGQKDSMLDKINDLIPDESPITVIPSQEDVNPSPEFYYYAKKKEEYYGHDKYYSKKKKGEYYNGEDDSMLDKIYSLVPDKSPLIIIPSAEGDGESPDDEPTQ